MRIVGRLASIRHCARATQSAIMHYCILAHPELNRGDGTNGTTGMPNHCAAHWKSTVLVATDGQLALHQQLARTTHTAACWEQQHHCKDIPCANIQPVLHQPRARTTLTATNCSCFGVIYQKIITRCAMTLQVQRRTLWTDIGCDTLLCSIRRLILISFIQSEVTFLLSE